MSAHMDVSQEEPSGLVHEPELAESPRQSVEIAVVQLVATWAVQHALAFAYRKATGHDEPTARDADVPMSRILVWAATTAAAVAVTNVVVDRLVLRPRTAEVRAS